MCIVCVLFCCFDIVVGCLCVTSDLVLACIFEFVVWFDLGG